MGFGAAAADEVLVVYVLVTVVLKDDVEDDTTVSVACNIVVVMIVVGFEVVLETICSGHNWKELVVLSHHRSISKRRYPILNKVLIAVMLSTEYCRVQNHDEVRLIPGRRICDIGISRAMSRWTSRADCIVEFGYTISL